MELIPIVELGVSEAFEILTRRFGVDDLPPLDSLENEDWGRDYLLSRFLGLPRSALADAGLCIDAAGAGPSAGVDPGSGREDPGFQIQ